MGHACACVLYVFIRNLNRTREEIDKIIILHIYIEVRICEVHCTNNLESNNKLETITSLIIYTHSLNSTIVDGFR